MADLAGIRFRFRALAAILDERSRRLLVAAESAAIGRGGISAVSTATGVSRSVIRKGMAELKQAVSSPPLGRVRRPGGGRKRATERDPNLQRDLEKLVEPVTPGDPESPLRWTCKSVRKLAEELNRAGHQTNRQTVAELLRAIGYSLQANRQTLEGRQHPDRNAQFEHINERVRQHLLQGQPVISVDTKKKELLGEFKNNGQEWRPKGEPEKVGVHDFPSKELGKVAPYGIYDLGRNSGWVSVGVDHDTSAFAVESIRRWWYSMGQSCYPRGRQLLITADAGGSNGARVRLWKWELQKLADETELHIGVCHFPPGSSKWNKIEHRLFSAISQNWRGKPLVNHEVIINLISATTTKNGLRVESQLDTNLYPKGIKISDKQMAEVQLRREEFHGDWNYSILPRTPQNGNVVS